MKQLFAGLLGLLICLGIVACAGPRSESMCLKNGYWVKCPKGVYPGTDLQSK